MVKIKKWAWCAVLAIVVGLLTYAYPFRLYYLRDSGGGIVLYNADQAYLFLTVVRRGYQLSYVQYPWELVSEWLGTVPLPKDQRVFLIVIHVTPSGADRHLALTQEESAGVPHSFTPVGQSVFTFCDGVLCKWVTDHFENATAEESQAIGGIQHLVPDSPTTVNGWNKRGVDGDFVVNIGSQTQLNVHRASSQMGTASVELDKAGVSPRELWPSFSGEPRRVNWRAYKAGFSGEDLR